MLVKYMTRYPMLAILPSICLVRVKFSKFSSYVMCPRNFSCYFLILSNSVSFGSIFFIRCIFTLSIGFPVSFCKPNCGFQFTRHLWWNCPTFETMKYDRYHIAIQYYFFISNEIVLLFVCLDFERHLSLPQCALRFRCHICHLLL